MNVDSITIPFGKPTYTVEWENPFMLLKTPYGEKTIIEYHIDRFLQKEGKTEKFLWEQFHKAHASSKFNDILAKVTFINSFYNTQIRNDHLRWVATRIFLLNKQYTVVTENGLSEGIVDYYLSDSANRIECRNLVDFIAFCDIEKNSPENEKHISAGNLYVFASKYCSWHQKNRFPIVDSLVMGLLWRLNEVNKNTAQKGFGTYRKLFRQFDMFSYSTYCDIYDDFMEFINMDRPADIEPYDYKKVDQYAWRYISDQLKDLNPDIEEKKKEKFGISPDYQEHPEIIRAANQRLKEYGNT